MIILSLSMSFLRDFTLQLTIEYKINIVLFTGTN